MKTIAKGFDNLWIWLVYSSENPGEISGSIKWGLGLVAVLLTGVFGFAHLQFPTADLTSLSDAIIALVQDILGIVTVLGTIFSLLRKIWLTIKGEHASLNTMPIQQAQVVLE